MGKTAHGSKPEFPDLAACAIGESVFLVPKDSAEAARFIKAVGNRRFRLGAGFIIHKNYTHEGRIGILVQRGPDKEGHPR